MSRKVNLRKSGATLLSTLQQDGHHLPAYCGGRGLCKKCTVEIEGRGPVLACKTRVDTDLTVILPEQSDFIILGESADVFRSVADNPGVSADGPCFGFAADIGTTTVVLYLYDLKKGGLIDMDAFINPQNDFGQDVVSRINHTMEDPGGLKLLQEKIISAINLGLDRMVSRSGLETAQIHKAVFAGNTTMLHLLLGVNPASIALAPFTPQFTEARQLAGKDLDLNMAPGGRVDILPSCSGYVGADITAGLTALCMPDSNFPKLLLDVGTNGEIVLGGRNGLFCCSAAAGPAFEGARIQHGTGCVAGAISEYHNGQLATIGHQRPVGICGSGLIDIVAHLLGEGLISPEGLLSEDFPVVEAKKSGVDHDIVLTPKDVRETQLAKAAIAAGLEILSKESGIKFEEVEEVYLAGGFGTHINPQSAVAVGLLPEALKDKITPVGNSAGAGAQLALRSIDFLEEVKKGAEKCRYVELSSRPDFNDEFINAMIF